jgi:ElaB/YqjD/DUF883 family membrane-anchored ribosome-binding protein
MAKTGQLAQLRAPGCAGHAAHQLRGRLVKQRSCTAGRWSRASGVADDVLAAGRRAAQTAYRQVDEHPLVAVTVGFVLGYIAALLIHGRR